MIRLQRRLHPQTDPDLSRQHYKYDEKAERGVSASPQLLHSFSSSFSDTQVTGDNMCTVGTSKLAAAMDSIVEVFKDYSSRGGDRHRLDFMELRRLIQAELGDYIKNSWDSRRVGAIMDDLDKNKDGNVSFEEFVSLVVTLTVRRYEFFKGCTPVVFTCGQISDGCILRQQTS